MEITYIWSILSKNYTLLFKFCTFWKWLELDKISWNTYRDINRNIKKKNHQHTPTHGILNPLLYNCYGILLLIGPYPLYIEPLMVYWIHNCLLIKIREFKISLGSIYHTEGSSFNKLVWKIFKTNSLKWYLLSEQS
jgi:hypothetical protein